VAEDGQEQVARLVDAFRVAADGLRDRLVDRLVEAREVVNVALVRLRPAVAPQPQHAGTQRPVLGNDFQQVEPRAQPAHGVLLGSAVQRRCALVPVAVAATSGLVGPLSGTLGRAHVPDGGEEDVARVIAQRQRVHLRARRDAAGERFPLDENRLDI
jgi:hypothetical protein